MCEVRPPLVRLSVALPGLSPKCKEVQVKVDLCPVSEIPGEGSKVVEFFGRSVHVVQGQGSVHAAYMDVCIHLGIPLVCSDGQFQCQWHGAVFDRESGKAMAGPLPADSRRLRLPTKVEDGVPRYAFGDGAEA
jgi:3-phenylpropionate/trans-cinnamate dioxygenase ferredoxin subunit